MCHDAAWKQGEMGWEPVGIEGIFSVMAISEGNFRNFGELCY